jgi:hypothetical protein
MHDLVRFDVGRFGVSGQPPVASVMNKVLPRYAKALGRHKADKAL